MNKDIRKKDIRRGVNRLTPSQVLVAFFFIIIMSGALLLMMPGATVNGELGFIDALFTATSAVCVTGLVVVDTGMTFTYLGKTVIIILIQLGGLGIMSYASIIYVFLKRKMSVSNMLVMRDALNQNGMSYLRGSISNMIKLTFFIEFLGAFLLSFRYIPMYGALKGAFFSVFHAISAFCNAGFDINAGYMTSITEFADDPLVVLTTAALIVLGGTGFVVLHEITHKKKNKNFSLQARVVVVMTIVLLLVGTVGFYLIEYTNPLTIGNPEMNHGTKIMSAFFQSVTLRTAGYNTIDQAALRMPSKLLSMVLMFIGASPASTGGGIKTTTFCILLMACYSTIAGHEDVEFKYRRVAKELALKAFVITSISFTFVIICSSVLMIFESNVAFEAILFEAFSAFGTVGVSLGITPELTTVSRIIIILTMFAGRVGPLTITTALAGTKDKKKLTKNVESTMMIG